MLPVVKSHEVTMIGMLESWKFQMLTSSKSNIFKSRVSLALVRFLLVSMTMFVFLFYWPDSICFSFTVTIVKIHNYTDTYNRYQ